jgi:hypothetical protein
MRIMPAVVGALLLIAVATPARAQDPPPSTISTNSVLNFMGQGSWPVLVTCPTPWVGALAQIRPGDPVPWFSATVNPIVQLGPNSYRAWVWLGFGNNYGSEEFRGNVRVSCAITNLTEVVYNVAVTQPCGPCSEKTKIQIRTKTAGMGVRGRP